MSDRVEFGSLWPNALFEIPGHGDVQVLSDDGGGDAHRLACRKRPAAEQAFRSITLKL